MQKKILQLRGMIYSHFESEAACARAIGWKRQKLSKITNGIKEPDVSELAELARALECSVDDLVQIFLTQKSPNEQQSA